MKRYESAEMRIIALNNNVLTTSGDPNVFGDDTLEPENALAPGRRYYRGEEYDF